MKPPIKGGIGKYAAPELASSVSLRRDSKGLKKTDKKIQLELGGMLLL